MASKVLLTGAGGRTGRLVLSKLQEKSSEYKVQGIVRRSEHVAELGSGVAVADIRQANDLEQYFKGVDRLVILTSAVPKMKPRSSPDSPPEFYYEAGLEPEQVDWVGQKIQIDLAKAHQLKQVVLVSSRGVTDPNNRLNAIGNGNILIWKRKAEQYLVDSGVPYTIIHPGGLTDAAEGQRQLVVTKADAEPDGASKVVPRADLAEVIMACLESTDALNKSFDLISMPEGEGSPTNFGGIKELLKSTTAGL